ncbi:YolD-like family protein [Lysinibacillus fusiformis]|uniref:YolD-like family protein n=1 Tax=Lysinibacillus fusiformis TaxID=28031 RepID=UPI0035C1DA06|nr:YolD-like family protein [Lysinibacillus fusiformis]
MINDRGNMKWTSMMLPEHLLLLKKWKQEVQTEPPRERAEWELEELQQTITRALTERNYIMLTVWEEANFVQYGGIIKGMNEMELLLETITTTKHIALKYIYAANIEVDGNSGIECKIE